ncbi:MAG: hypothetical protein ACM3SU_09715 [Acidobacteriota bacterium]
MYRGNLTLCCQLSGYEGGTPDTFMGNLQEVSLAEACAGFRRRVETYLADKRERVARGEFTERDHFPCWHSVKYLDKVPRLGTLPRHARASRWRLPARGSILSYHPGKRTRGSDCVVGGLNPLAPTKHSA